MWVGEKQFSDTKKWYVCGEKKAFLFSIFFPRKLKRLKG